MPASATPAIHGARLHPPNIEQAYRDRCLRHDAWVIAAGIGIATAAYAVFSASDFLFAATPRVLAAMLGVRVLFTLVGIAAIWSLLRTRRPVVLDAWVVAWSLAYALRGVALESIRPPDHFMPLLAEIAVLMSLWVIFPVRFGAQVAAAALVTAGAFAWMLTFRAPPRYDGWAMIVGTWIAGNGIGAYVSWTVHRERRATYLDMLRLAAAEKAARDREVALQASETRFRTLTNAAPVGVFQADVEGNCLFMNPAMERILGLSGEAARGKAWMDQVHPEDRERVFQEWRAAVAERRPYTTEFRGLVPGGRETWVRSHGSGLLDAEGRSTGYMAVVVDITEQRATQNKLAVTSRLAAMGTFVSGLAHEINNPLAASLSAQSLALDDVQNARDLLGREGAPDAVSLLRLLDAMAETLRDAQAGASRVAGIVKEMTATARPNVKRSRVRTLEVVQEAMRWIPAASHQRATIEVFDRGAPDALASAGQIARVLVNLLTNAVKAIPAGRVGRIGVTCEPGTAGMVRIEVTDDGEGMGPATIERVFDPFFTTRSVGDDRGTGLGLAMCQAIVTAHGGTLTVESELGKGSTFRLELPAAADAG